MEVVSSGNAAVREEVPAPVAASVDAAVTAEVSVDASVVAAVREDSVGAVEVAAKTSVSSSRPKIVVEAKSVELLRELEVVEEVLLAVVEEVVAVDEVATVETEVGLLEVDDVIKEVGAVDEV